MSFIYTPKQAHAIEKEPHAKTEQEAFIRWIILPVLGARNEAKRRRDEFKSIEFKYGPEHVVVRIEACTTGAPMDQEWLHERLDDLREKFRIEAYKGADVMFFRTLNRDQLDAFVIEIPNKSPGGKDLRDNWFKGEWKRVYVQQKKLAESRASAAASKAPVAKKAVKKAVAKKGKEVLAPDLELLPKLHLNTVALIELYAHASVRHGVYAAANKRFLNRPHKNKLDREEHTAQYKLYTKVRHMEQEITKLRKQVRELKK